MSDDEQGSKKSGYRLEYSPTARAGCKGPMPCKGTKLAKGELRFGSLVDFKGNTSFAWRHWGCVTSKIIANMKKSFDEADELDGFEDLQEEDQEKIRTAWEKGHVAEEDIPLSAVKLGKNDGVDQDDDDDEDEKPAKKKATAKATKKAANDESGVFHLEYSSSARAKCKGCSETIGKDFFRIGHEVIFRGNKTFQYLHWGCIPTDMFNTFKNAYPKSTEIPGYNDLKPGEKDKVENAWIEGDIPEDDKGPGEAVAGVTKKPAAKRAKKEADDEPPKKRARKAKDEEDDEEEEKPKAKRAPAKKPAAEKKAPAKKRATKKKKEESDESAEDFGDAIDAVSGDEDDAEEEEELPKKKTKRAPAPKASSSQPASKRAAAKPAARPNSRRKVQEYTDDEDDE